MRVLDYCSVGRIGIHHLFRVLAFLLCCSVGQGLTALTHAAMIDDAKKEGRLVWYTSMGAGDAKLIVDAFEKDFGFVKVDLVRLSDEGILNRIAIENRAGGKPFDVVSASQISSLVQQKAVTSYVSPASKEFPHEAKDPGSLWTAMYYNYYALGYNSKLASAAEAPKKWADLLNPKWKGKIAMDRDEIPWYATLLSVWKEPKTSQYMKALAGQDIQWRKGHTLIASLMAAGEFPLAIVYSYTVDQMKNDGAPVEWIRTLDPVIAQGGFIGLGARATNINSAKLFIDFVLSPKGQNIFGNKFRIPARSGMRAGPKLDVGYVPGDIGSRYQEYRREFQQFFGL
jgi:iron(III) transport system substrate-binding protein